VKWSLAYDFPSIDAVVSNPSTESTPDGLAENCVVPSNTGLGMTWLGEAGVPGKSCDFAVSCSANFVVVVGANYSDDATVRFYRDVTARQSLLVTLTRCSPANIWAGTFATTSFGAWSYAVSDTGAPAGGLETPLILFGRRVDIARATVGRPARGYTYTDPSTRVGGQTGATWTAKQRRQFRQAFSVIGQNRTDGIADMRAMWGAAGRSALVVSFLDADDLGGYGNTNVGIIETDITEAIALGMTTGFDVSIMEAVA
jgi:uncharacterized membrane protein